jgi:oxygen-dependent protoporphyrinogen oxidase
VAGPQAVIIGGGIAGLSAAFEFHRAGWSVTVHEASDRWGGKVWTSPVGDRPVDAGPDSFLARVADGRDLCRDLGLEAELTSPVAPVPAYLYLDDPDEGASGGGRLHPLPAASMLGVPTDLDELRSSTLISPAGIDRAAHDLTMAPTPLDPDPSVGEVCRARLGDEVTDRLIDPLIGAINASDIDRLSLTAAAPQLAAALTEKGSLIAGMAAFRGRVAAIGSRDRSAPVFHGLPGGIARIIDGLVDAMAEHDLRLNSPVRSLADVDPSADAVIIAVPAFAAANLLAGDHDAADPRAQAAPAREAARLLEGIEYADVAQAVVDVPVDGLEQVLDASGILFPRVTGRLMTACTWLSTKWAHYHRPESVLIRLSAGRFGDDRHAELSDDELVSALMGELGQVIGMERPPTATRVVRWQRAFPQYTPGHRRRVDAIRGELGQLDPRLSVVGAPYDGIGLPACIAAGRAAARAALDRTDHR